MMKKVLTVFLTATIFFSVTACSSNTTAVKQKNEEKVQETKIETENKNGEVKEIPNSVTLKTKNGSDEFVEVEFPYNPQKLAVMDLGTLDILDSLGYGDKITGVSKGSSIDYLQTYMINDDILNLGTVKEVDMEAVLECEPDIIFIGGRLASVYDELAKIAPVYMMYTDTEIGVVESTRANAKKIASLFGSEDSVEQLIFQYISRIETLQDIAKEKTAIVSMVNAGGFGLLGNDGRCSIIGNEIGFKNIGIDAKIETSAHGNEASFEFVLDKNPDYIFVLDRDAAIGTKGAKLAAEVLDNDLVNMTDAAANGNIIILEHSNVWYTAEGGIRALGIMLSDLEKSLLD
ncbi:MAG: siderophore ABC transporter substrate-binding protein [Lachnospiraceae bacterium]